MCVSQWPRGTARPTLLSIRAAAVATVSVLALSATGSLSYAQQNTTELPPVSVVTTTPKAKPKAAKQAAPVSAPQQAAIEAPSETGLPAPGTRSGSLGVPTTAEATAEIQLTPGAVEVVPDTAYKTSTPSATIKDVLDYVPGVFVQPKWGEDSRLSIRGSGLSRNFHLRGVQLYMDGIPINTADGFGDFQEIDPTAYRYVEVYKGANALRFGANSLGGAINFVMPTGYDADLFGARVDVGSFGFHKLSASSGGVHGAADYFITGTWQEQDGFRDHSFGESVRGALNVGYRLIENVETRFYVNANDVEQRIPGAVSRETALTDPKQAAPINVTNDWQRNIETVRIANRTTVRLAPGTFVEVGAFNVDRQLDHPIFRWLDYRYDDYGGYVRLTDDSMIGGYRNRFLIGSNLHNGTVDAKQFEIGPNAARGDLLSHNDDRAENFSVYAENSFFVTPDVSLIGGLQYLHAVRDREVVFSIVGDQAGKNTFDAWSPKVGVLWDVDPGWQVFANISKSVEVPSFGENVVDGSAFTAKLQEAWTYEIGTRGRRENYHWDISLYRAEIENELQCLTIVMPFFTNTCSVTNADETIHQGVELGFGAAIWSGLFETAGNLDKLWLHATYTFSDFRFDNDPLWGDNELPGAPRHYLRAELLYRHPSGVYFGPNIEWVPEAYYVDNANTLETDAYAIWGAKVGYEGETFSAYIEGRNLSDEAYISSASVAGNLNGVDGAYFEPGTGRAIYGGVQVKW